jgi:hypothetical protein
LAEWNEIDRERERAGPQPVETHQNRALVTAMPQQHCSDLRIHACLRIELAFDFGMKSIMSGEKLSAAQRLAIQNIIRAKSDREIARILRQSYRLLNLHHRRRSGWSRRERWMDYELRLLGRMRAKEMARLFRRSANAVAAKRESLGIAIFAPQRMRWSRREIELLGKRPDAVVARMLGRTRYAVQLKRHSLGIPQCWENRRPWSPEEDALLGTMRDSEVAKKLKRSVSSVRSRRLDKTKVRFICTPKRWTAAQLRLLGKLPEVEVARRTGRFLASVRNKRVQLGTPRFAVKR